MAAIPPPPPWSLGCDVCEGGGKDNCQTFVNNKNLENISGQATFGIDPETEIYIYNVYTVDTNTSIHFNECTYAQ